MTINNDMGMNEDVLLSIKEKWLDFCEANPLWLKGIKETSAKIKIGNAEVRPYGYLILGVISGLLPELTSIIPIFLKINGDPDATINALGLHFDPEVELKKRQEERAKNPKPSVDPDTEYLNQIREQIAKENANQQ